MTNNPTYKRRMNVNRHFSKEYIQTANKKLEHEKMLNIREMQIMTIIKSHFTLTRRAFK